MNNETNVLTVAEKDLPVVSRSPVWMMNHDVRKYLLSGIAATIGLDAVNTVA